MGNILKPRYEYDNETSVLPEGDSQNDSLWINAIAEAERAKIREKIWDAYEHVPSAGIAPSVDSERANTLSAAEIYADWNVKDFTFMDAACEDEVACISVDYDMEDDTDPTLEIINNLAPSRGGVHEKIGAKKRSHQLGKGGVQKYRSSGLSSAARQSEKKAAKAQEAKFKAVVKDVVASKPPREIS